MHGVGVFDYATIPGVIQTQVYMCPFAPCTEAMMATGECLTFIQAVAVKLENATGVDGDHLLIWRNAGLHVDDQDRRAEANFSLGREVSVTASGRGTATAHPKRVQHESLADCHVLETKGQLVPKDRLASAPYPRTLQPTAELPLGKHEAAATQQAGAAAEAAEAEQATGQQAKGSGGVWAECTNNEWTLSSAGMRIDVGVIGPFEEGYIRDLVSDRTFNLNVVEVKEPEKLQGIINGDTNGLFVVDPELNPEPMAVVDPNVGAVVPLGPHGNVQEVTAPNVPPGEVLFPMAAMAIMDAACGAQQSLRAIRMTDSEAASYQQNLKRGGKSWKSRSGPM